VSNWSLALSSAPGRQFLLSALRRISDGACVQMTKRNAITKTIVPPDTTGTYLTTPEAACYIKLSKQYLEGARYRGDGSGPPFIKLERAVRYRKSALDAWMTAHDHAADKPL
jgi:predicted DNA-binding transcriptional regulator AlpA